MAVETTHPMRRKNKFDNLNFEIFFLNFEKPESKSAGQLDKPDCLTKLNA